MSEEAGEAPAEPETTTGVAERPSAADVAAWSGHRLDDVGGANVGKVEGAYLDADGGHVEWLLVRMGRFGHHGLIPARDAVGGVGRVWVPYSRDQIRRAPRIEPKTSLTKEGEIELLEHYGVGGDVGRAAEIRDAESDAVTARPA
jgi:hypothetical protein